MFLRWRFEGFEIEETQLRFLSSSPVSYSSSFVVAKCFSLRKREKGNEAQLRCLAIHDLTKEFSVV